MLLLLLANTVGQLANQVTRVIYYDYALSNAWPGSLWVNVFFGQNMACGMLGGLLQFVSEARLRKSDPERFGEPISLNQLVTTVYERGQQWWILQRQRMRERSRERSDRRQERQRSPKAAGGKAAPHAQIPPCSPPASTTAAALATPPAMSAATMVAGGSEVGHLCTSPV